MNKVNLTKYSSGGIGELLSIAWPMILTSAVSSLMVMVDRMILSRYSVEAFNACFGAIQWCWALYFTPLEFTFIAEVFVGQYNGARRFREIGPLIWQMIWLCLALFALFIPIALWGPPLLLADNIAQLGIPYMRIILLFIPIAVIGYGALVAFFVGRGETKIVSVATIISGILNAILDCILIFGWGGIPEYGIVGAAVATVISQSLLTLLLFCIFLKKSNREIYGTGQICFRPKLLKQCLKVGSPNALNRLISSFIWATMTQIIVKHVTEVEFQGYSISHSIYLLFYPVVEGISAGVRTVCSNAIGARTFEIVRKNIRSWLFLAIISIIFSLLGMVIYPDGFIGLFLKEMGGSEAYGIARHMLHWAWFVFALDVIVMNALSVLLASGDTKFTMLVNTLSFFLFAVLPTYIAIVYFHCGSVIFWQFFILDSSIRLLCFILRYRSGRWVRGRII
ncbi:MAG: MATE family efflux transporter [Puniceicoccales bacterium]|jgi:MATE family multidrug resistance protein|nr:MATE family efflux transporter [Puniceicoccales bacterium]